MTEAKKRKRKRLYIPSFSPKPPPWLKRIREGLDRGQSADDVIEGMIRKDKKP